jgi:hypothetical protein
MPEEMLSRKRKHEDGETEGSDMEGEDDRKAPITDERVLAALMELTSHSSRFNVETTKMEVMSVLQWFFTDTARLSRLVFETKYQRNQNVGWDSEKKSQYLASVMADQAAAPIVVNIVRVEARLMDGGHRLQTLVEFYKGEIPMAVKGHEVYIGQLPETDKQHFYSRKLQVMEFKNLPFKDEVDYYIKLNSALPLSWGERFYSTTSCNPVTKIADLVSKEHMAEDDVKTLCKMLGSSRSLQAEAGRKSDLLAVTVFVFHVFFRDRGDPVILKIADNFMQEVFKLNEGTEWRDSKKHKGKTLVEIKDKAVELLKRTLDLCKTVEQHQQRQQAQQQFLPTPFRLLVTCMLAVREIEEDQLRSELLWKLMTDTGNSGLKIFTGKSKELKTKDIRAFTVAYGRLT